MQRVLIIGSPGAGKSTLAKALAARTGLPLIHLDDLYWHPGWVRVDKALWHQRLQDALDGETWIIDGNYNSTLGLRAARADTVIFLAPPRELCVWRVLWRELSGRHPHMQGLKRRLPEWWFLRYTWQFPRKLSGMLDVLAEHKPLKVVLLHGDGEARAWLDAVDVWESGDVQRHQTQPK